MLLTARDAAALLACSEKQIYRWVHEAKIPFRRVRDQVRFNRTDLLEWAAGRRLPVSIAAFDENLGPDDRVPSLMQALRIGGVHHDLVATDQDSALRAVVENTPIPASLDREFLIAILTARENTVSTAVGNGIAIPHVRQPIAVPGASATVSVSYLRTPVLFGTHDQKPVQTIFLAVSPSIREHLQMLARIARAILDPGFRAALDRRASTEDLAAAAGRLEDAASSVADSQSQLRGGLT